MKKQLLSQITFAALMFILLIGVHKAQAQIPAFPGAEGYGKYSVGGRGGQIIEVTNLNDTGTGSLRAACAASGPRIVVFRVAGTISLSTHIVLSNPYITIAGQTAPGDGICLRFNPTTDVRAAIAIATHDIIIRYIRIRCGFSTADMSHGSPIVIQNTSSNVILDHCSTSWHPGRTGATIWPIEDNVVENITIQHHLAGEPLFGGIHPSAARGAFLFGNNASASVDSDGRIDKITLYNSLMAHHRKRHPEAKSIQLDSNRHISTFQIINNVAYHFSSEGAGLYGNENDDVNYHFTDDVTCNYNVFGNYFKRSQIVGNKSEIAITPGTRLYVGDSLYGNIGPNRPTSASDPWSIVSYINWGPNENYLHAPSSPYQVLSPFDASHLPPYVTATQAYTNVLADVGANKGLNADGSFRNERDTVDARLVNDVINNTGDFIDDPSDVGGWPTYSSGAGAYTDTDGDGMSDTWETAKGLNPSNAADGPMIAANGYTYVEHFLNGSNPGPPPCTLPAGVSTANIGGTTGQSSCESGGVFTIDAEGTDIWGTSDQFSFTHIGLNGDGTLIARVLSVENTSSNAKSGIMFRETLAAGSKYVACMVTPGNGITGQMRSSTNGTTVNAVATGLSAPYWVQVTRAGNVFSVYYSPNGSTWTQLGPSVTVSMATNIYVGLAATSNVDGTLGTSVISDISGSALSSSAAILEPANDEKQPAAHDIPMDVKIFPNPNDGNFTISFNAIERSDYSIEVRSVNGSLIYSRKLAGFSGLYSRGVSIASAGKGTYIVSLKKDGRVISKKVVVY